MGGKGRTKLTSASPNSKENKLPWERCAAIASEFLGRKEETSAQEQEMKEEGRPGGERRMMIDKPHKYPTNPNPT